MTRHHKNAARRSLALTPVIVCLVLAACGDDDDEASSSPDAVTADAPAASDAQVTTTAGETIEVTATDYAYAGIPATVAPGTKLSLTNASATELHELVVIRVPDGEARSVEELIALPEAEQEAIFGNGPPAVVQLAMPGSNEPIPAVGDGTVTEPGRYAVVCFIPQGADPDEFMAAAETSGDGPPDVAGGPPHAMLGMYAEFTVEG